MKQTSFVIAVVLLFVGTLFSQQVGDKDFNLKAADPAYPHGMGPVVLIDEAHYNFHTLDGRYKPFAQFLESDGYVVRKSDKLFTKESLEKGDILVIANALSKENEEEWANPMYPAFTKEEVAAVTDWVKNGGSLFLIADHMPFPGVAVDLARAFGVEFNNGFALAEDPNQRRRPMIFRRSDGSIKDHAITRGRSSAERIDSVATFTGQAFQPCPDDCKLLVFGLGVVSFMPEVAWEFSEKTPKISVTGWCQGAAKQFGKGRVVIFGEAAMFTSQVAGNDITVGMRSPEAGQNPQLLLNIMRWLSWLIE